MPVTGSSGDIGDDAQLLTSLVGDLRIILARDVGAVLVKFLVKWGFMSEDRQVMAKQAGRYIAAIARGIITAVLEERDKMEVERARGS
jgi:hypothetical protein